MAREAGPIGVSALVLAVAALAFAIAAWAANPVEEGADHVGRPLAEAFDIIAGRCPDGWEDKTSKDEHTRVRSCERDGWLVILKEDGSFDYGLEIDNPSAIPVFSESEVPEWQ